MVDRSSCANRPDLVVPTVLLIVPSGCHQSVHDRSRDAAVQLDSCIDVLWPHAVDSSGNRNIKIFIGVPAVKVRPGVAGKGARSSDDSSSCIIVASGVVGGAGP